MPLKSGMQFKHPEILWALLLLLIPILVHLLQLRRFKKTPFTNVAMLQKVVSESRKSQNLKKWLLLLTRMLLIAGLVVAFTQPFSSRSDALTKREMVIYLDNSQSMWAKNDGLPLFTRAVQDLIQEIPESTVFTLFTNDRTFKEVTIDEVQNELLSLTASSEQLSLEQIGLKTSALFSDDDNTIKDVLILSDLQQRSAAVGAFDTSTNVNVVQLRPNGTNNSYIDSIYLGPVEDNQIPLNVQVKGLANEETLPISLYSGNQLIAKTAVKGTNDENAVSVLSLEKGKPIQGRVLIEEPVLRYDNHFYFNIDERKKPKILAISEENASFLTRVFAEDNFEFQNTSLSTLNYSILESQNTIVLNGLEAVPNSLSTQLWDFSKNGGSLIIIPAVENLEIDSYNSFLKPLLSLQFESAVTTEQNISRISFQHPLYQNVFEKEVTNFDYPKVNSYYRNSSNSSSVLFYDDGSPFLANTKNVYVFTASLTPENSTFINSPLIVPTLYNIGELSLKNPALYQTIGVRQTVDIPQKIGQDNILKLRGTQNEFIPLQQAYSNKVRLQFNNDPSADGIYAVLNGNDTVQHLSFNFRRTESQLKYIEAKELEGFTAHENISGLFEQLRQDTSITNYWKWFVTFALLCVVLELLIQKLLP